MGLQEFTLANPLPTTAGLYSTVSSAMIVVWVKQLL